MRLGVDVGGTKIEGIALAGRHEVARTRVRTPRDDYDATLAAIAATVAELEQTAGRADTVGVGIPGTISPVTGLVKNANSVWLIGRPLQEDLERALGREVRIANDANCFAVSEATDGAGAGRDVVFGVIVGTGTGAGIVAHGRILTGPHGIAGEWGHNPLPWPGRHEWPGPPCYCGKNGCIETFLSGPGLAADYARSVADAGHVPRRGRAEVAFEVGTVSGNGAARQPEEIVWLAANGDAMAEAAIVRYEQRMARALASVINILDPDVIVLGGGMSNILRLYENVPRYLADLVFARGPHERVRTSLVRAQHGDASGVRGAAWLWNETGAS
jgi:fructokinase